MSSVESQAEVCSEVTGLSAYEFKPQTQSKLFLWRAWKQAEEKIYQLEVAIKVLQQEKCLKQPNYETDEEELTWETKSNRLSNN